MAKTPFIYLRDNADKIMFFCDTPAQEKAYRNAFTSMLTRLDKYFIDKGLYACNNYQKLVEDMLSNKKSFRFAIDKKMRESWDGYCTMYDGKGDYIAIKPEIIGKGTTTEGILCHEFFHHLTTGQEKIEYKKDGYKHVMQMSDGKNLTYGDNKYQALSVDYTGNLLKRCIFITEGLTELSKQEVYGAKECNPVYRPQTKMVKFINTITGEEENMAGYLRAEIPNYNKYLGSNNFKVFVDMCNSYQTCFEDDGPKKHYAVDPLYIKAQDYFVDSVLSRIKDLGEKVSAKDMVRIIKTIVKDAPVKRDYMDKCQQSVKDYSYANHKAQIGEGSYFEKILKDAINANILGGDWNLPDSNATKCLGDLISFYKENGKTYIRAPGFNQSIDSLGPSIVLQGFAKNAMICINRQNGGYYSVELKDVKTKEVQESFNFTYDSKKTNKMVVAVQADLMSYNVNLERLAQERQKQVEVNTNLLDNFEHFRAIGEIVNNNNARVVDVRTIKNQNNEEYLIASTNGGAHFYKVTSDGYEEMKVTSKKTPQLGSDIRSTIHLGENKDKQPALKGYKKTGLTTEEDAVVYTLSDGTKFVEYTEWDKDGKNGKSAFGLQVKPFAGKEDEFIVKQQSTTLYDCRNESLATIFGSDYTYDDFGHELIIRRSSGRSVETAVGEKEVLDYQRKKAGLSNEEIIKRNNAINSEIERIKREKAKQSTNFQDLTRKVEQKRQQQQRRGISR